MRLVEVKVKLITGTYILQVNKVTFNQNEISPLCLLCQENDKTTEHFILHCSALSVIEVCRGHVYTLIPSTAGVRMSTAVCS